MAHMAPDGPIVPAEWIRRGPGAVKIHCQLGTAAMADRPVAAAAAGRQLLCSLLKLSTKRRLKHLADRPLRNISQRELFRTVAKQRLSIGLDTKARTDAGGLLLAQRGLPG